MHISRLIINIIDVIKIKSLTRQTYVTHIMRNISLTEVTGKEKKYKSKKNLICTGTLQDSHKTLNAVSTSRNTKECFSRTIHFADKMPLVSDNLFLYI